MTSAPPPPPQPQGFPGTPPPYQAPPAPPGAPAGIVSPADPSAVRPKAVWIWVSVAVLVLGVVAAIAIGVVGFFGIADEVDDFERVARGSGTVQIDSTDQQVIYSEEGLRFPSVTILDPDGEELRTRVYVGSLTYSFDGRNGEAALTFRPTAPGTYTIQTDVDIAIGPSIASSLIRTIVIPFVVGGLAFLVGGAMLIVVLVRRSRSRTRLAVR